MSGKDAALEFHDAANIFPMDDEHLDELVADIKEHGQQVPIELLDGKILDGRRRYTACRMAGVEPNTVDVSPDDPVAHVLSLNLQRRHLTASQRAMVAGKARGMYDAAAKERQAEGQERGRKSQAGALVKQLPPSKREKARDQAGKAVGVSGAYVDRATRVLTKAIPEVAKAVEEGRLSVSSAAELADEDEETQRKVAEEARVSGGRFRRPKVDRKQEQEKANGERRGVGVIIANEAINCLIRIPKNDALRKRGFQIVTDWINANK